MPVAPAASFEPVEPVEPVERVLEHALDELGSASKRPFSR